MSSKKKKKIILHSNHCRMKTGFGKHMKHLLTYLYKTNKYDIIEFANGRPWDDPSLSNLPWKAFGSLPTEPNLVSEIKSDPQKQRAAGYGQYTIDKIIEQEKPDIYLGIEDVWGLEGFWSKHWWKKIHSLIWTPVDSIPLLDKHLDACSKTKNVIVQASFAKKALDEKSYNNIHLLPVPLDVNNFYRLNDNLRLDLRNKNGIDPDSFIIGFVFRNQLRKSVPNLLEGFRIFKELNPTCPAKLLLHTHWGEGWDINKLIQEKNIDKNDVLTTYYCNKCKQYEIKPFGGQDLDCKFCGSKKSQQTAQVDRGVNEEQLNEIYNLMDVYCHAFTSGGQEIPIQEAKLTELVTLVTNYSCGEDYSTPESGGLPLNWTEYREPGTQFIKASTISSHIAEQLSHVYNMSDQERSKMGKKARDFVIDFCSIDSVCSKFESIISKLPKIEWDYNFSYIPQNDKYTLTDIESDRDWIIDLYKNILNVDNVEEEDLAGLNHWLERLNTDLNRAQVHQYFIETARKNNTNNQKTPFSDLLDTEDEGKRILFILPENEIDILNSTSLLKFISDKHKNHNIYYATNPQYYDIISSCPYVHKVVPYDDCMIDFVWAEGQGDYKGMFEFVLMPNTNTEIRKNYIHGNKHPINYDINYA